MRLLTEAAGHQMTNEEDLELFRAIVALQSLDPGVRRLSTLARTLPKPLTEALSRWVDGGQFARWFDNAEDHNRNLCERVARSNGRIRVSGDGQRTVLQSIPGIESGRSGVTVSPTRGGVGRLPSRGTLN